MQAGFRGWHERGYLPHRDEPGLVQFVTYRLADCFPQALIHEWKDLLKIADDRERRIQLEDYLDRGRGTSVLRDARVASIVEGTLLKMHREQYELRSWVIMPNHVHVLFKVLSVPMSEIVGAWKSVAAHLANPVLKRKEQLWAEDYWDTYIRSEEHEIRVRNYIEKNPVKAGLVAEARLWPWSSARFRDDRMQLDLGA